MRMECASFLSNICACRKHAERARLMAPQAIGGCCHEYSDLCSPGQEQREFPGWCAFAFEGQGTFIRGGPRCCGSSAALGYQPDPGASILCWRVDCDAFLGGSAGLIYAAADGA